MAMKKNGSKALGVALVLVLGAIGTVAFAHSTGNERRNKAQCAAIDVKKYNPAEVGWCEVCVAQGPPKCAAGKPDAACMHYHPGDPDKTRCRPDDGKP
jgi:hypothetical protein